MNQQNWTRYYKAISGRSPRPLLLEAMKYLVTESRVLELGSGDFVETILLLDNGHTVVAVDSSDGSRELAKRISNPHFSFEQKNFSDFTYTEKSYDMVLALFSLPFHGKQLFNELFSRIKDSLKSEGIFCANFFGTRDEWNTVDSNLVFHSKEDINSLLTDFEILKLEEIEMDKETASGELKHWHIFEVIAKKSRSRINESV